MTTRSWHWRYQINTGGKPETHATTLYRDPGGLEQNAESGSFRQRCMILDYRFARALDRPGYMMRPVIDRGLLADWQLWMPAEPPPAHDESREQLLIARRFPLMSAVWTGLALILFGTAIILLSNLRRTALPALQHPP